MEIILNFQSLDLVIKKETRMNASGYICPITDNYKRNSNMCSPLTFSRLFQVNCNWNEMNQKAYNYLLSVLVWYMVGSKTNKEAGSDVHRI